MKEFAETGVNAWGTQEGRKGEPGYEAKFFYGDFAAKQEFQNVERALVQWGALPGNAELAVKDGKIRGPHIHSLRIAVRGQDPEELLRESEEVLKPVRLEEN